ncbi:TetR/AcrR family transcriptional regulator [Elizabethkingia sp. HX WHF]|jgi:AcrR family transcriptional regulator|uniref:TetR family transcriptional regulator n=4 Tax=Elizabethkingia TaxID=308865 RepID=A0AAQ1SYA6_ELIMR|nr:MULTISPECIES: TetR/AcrR family transcriptional regulator [Elizabethkingia]MDR2230386.1 TetR/AcrR family transcriptional regulator [Flavobacteriaceae bacterium]AJW64223.1 putative HTH-type transcriptional regulator YttP [Elizabethkingia miricola]AQX08712.1 TetR family transcriptional regulator [Elizabethkingia ursingii]AQX86832.1 TetR family transcriptional regulator [Elizabethkingia bruuniana]ATL44389.1 TetR/AcrR family transcriptional regulator [Elizabethkingia miricola]
MRKIKKLSEKQLHILEVAESLIAEKGFKGTSVREICSQANINVAMISYYFGSKDKMMFHLYQYRVQKAKENFSNFTQTISSASPAMQMKEILNFILGQILKFNYFHGFVTNECHTAEPNKEFLRDFYALCVTKFEEVVQKGIVVGEFKKAVKPENLLATILGTIIFSIRNREFYQAYLPEHNEEDYYQKLEERLKTHLYNTVFSLLGYETNDN